ncbi:MAG: VOC family protein [Bacteroidota bacterium]
MSKGRITGIGGIFFKCDDPQKTKEWYNQNLGLKTDQWGAPFEFRMVGQPDSRAYAQWSTFPSDTTYFDPAKNEFMVNYRVENLEALLEDLREKGVTICDEVATYDYGKFVHILDGDGRKIELWEPIDKAFDSMYPDGTTNK